MKRSGPLRRTALRRGAGPERRARLRPRSRKAARQHDAYVAFVRQRLAESPWCEVCELIEQAGHRTLAREMVAPDQPNAWHFAEGLHHRRKRSDQGAVISVHNTVRACNWANGWIEDHPALVRDTPALRHLCVRQGDPEWENLGRQT